MKHRSLTNLEIIVAVAIVWTAILTGCSKTETAGAQNRTAPSVAKAVDIETVKQETVHRAVDLVATLSALDEVTISSEVDGAVSKILVDLGDPVKAGQVMVELDHEKLQYSLDQQNASFA